MAEIIKITEAKWITTQDYEHPGEKPRVYTDGMLGDGKLICEVGNAERWSVAKDQWEYHARAIAALPDFARAADAILKARRFHVHPTDREWAALRDALNRIQGASS